MRRELVTELPPPLIPADAGIQPLPSGIDFGAGKVWVPASAGTIGVGESARPKCLPPIVHQDGLAILAAHDAPVGIGLAADNNHIDVLLRKNPDRFVGCGLEPGGHRLLTER